MVELHKWTILTLTRDKDTKRIIRETLDDADNEVIIVSSIKEFFEKIKQKDVDLVIYDPKVASLKALDAFSLVKTYHSNIPTLLMFNEEQFDIISSIMEKGFVFRVSKPLKKAYLEQIYEGICKHKSE